MVLINFSNAQHYAFTAALDSLYACKDIVEEILAPREGDDSPTILDLGRPYLHRCDRLPVLSLY